MRAIEMLREKLRDGLSFMHMKQEAALWRMVEGLLNGQQVWLTELGRALPGECAIKHRIKAVDRFIGSCAMQSYVSKIYAALARFLLKSLDRPVLLIDWTGTHPGFFMLSAKLAFEGRALTILSRTYPEKQKATPGAEREFLEELKTIIPARCRPVLVTDAGFIFSWSDAVLACGMDYVCRARFKKMRVNVKGRCMQVVEAYDLARRKPRDLGAVLLGKNNPRQHRAVLSRRPRRKGRKRLNLRGKPRVSGMVTSAEGGAREPLFLMTSLTDPAAVVVAIYCLRMQIEQTFRDLKSHRYGWSARLIRSKQPRRVDVLFLIAAIAAIAMHVLGIAIKRTKHVHGLQANTERKRRVFSTFFLGKLTLAESLEDILSVDSLRIAIRKLLAAASSIERLQV